MPRKHYDVVVIGGGHAGCEAAAAAARVGARTALFTLNPDMIAQMSCNPSIGGIAKGHLVREIDALGGLMGQVADETGIQFRLLNRRRGPAVQAPRAQCDKERYRRAMQRRIESTPRLSVERSEIVGLLRSGGRVTGVETADGVRLDCRAVVLTTGTFLNGLCHVGERKFRAGRSGERAAVALAESIRTIGFSLGRLKTGTPPRVARESLDLDRFPNQPGDENPTFFSFESRATLLPQVDCWIAWTNQRAHQILRKNLHRSPLYSGEIEGIGPRYCPSIEDKIVKFPDRRQHQLFLEPEGLNTNIIYINGLSTSMPVDVQRVLLAAVEGLEEAFMVRPGYAVEYDFVQPSQLQSSLETRAAEGLFHAGQINGTTGYEEAAAQGLVAGINAGLKAIGENPFIPSRSESYIGILIDDLVTRGVDEPYRMFTSRAEYRLLLRIDNADRRLMPHGGRLGLVCGERLRRHQDKWENVDHAVDRLRNRLLKGDSLLVRELERRFDPTPGTSLDQILKRPECRIEDLLGLLAEEGLNLTREEAAAVETEIKYEGYIRQQLRDVERIRGLEERKIPGNLDYRRVAGLSLEMVERLERIRPETLGQASRIPGITPAAVSVLNIHLNLDRAPS